MLPSEITKIISGRLIGYDRPISRLSGLKLAEIGDLSILAWPEQIRQAKESRAGGIITTIDWAADYADEIASALIVIEDWPQVFKYLDALLEQGLFGERLLIGSPQIGYGSYISAAAHICNDVIVGKDCVIEAGVVVHSDSMIGDRVYIGANSVIGSAAFAPHGLNRLSALCSLGRVRIGDDVSIGALCSVDRGLIAETMIGHNCQLDNQVHIGHDVILGESVAIAAQSGLAGFVELGDRVSLGGQAGVAPHAVIGEGARLSGQALVRGKIGAYEVWSGSPSMPHQVFLRDYAGRLRNGRKNC